MVGNGVLVGGNGVSVATDPLMPVGTGVLVGGTGVLVKVGRGVLVGRAVPIWATGVFVAQAIVAASMGNHTHI